jgi:DNA-binding transcriptional ArsR family regulator
MRNNSAIHSNLWQAAEDAVPSRKQAVAVASVAAGLSDPNRLSLALVLRVSRTASIADLADLTGIERSVVSRHLGKLERAGLSSSRRRGKLAVHTLTDDGRRLLDFLMPPAAPMSAPRPTTMPGPERFRR